MRDFLAATRDRVVVFDGGMGATLEQFDLSLEKDYRLPGRCHEALILNRPDVIQGVHESMVEAGAEVVETDTFQASRLKLEEWGLAEHTLEINVKRRADRPQGGRREPLRRRLDRPDRLPARVRGPVAGPDPLPRARRGLPRAVRRPARGRRRPPDRRDRAGHPRGQGRDLRHARGVQDRRPQRADPGLRLAAAQRRQDAAGHRHQRRAGDARGAEGRRHRPQLLDRPRGHARRDPLPRRVLAGAGALHPERRHPASGPRRRDRLPREPGRARRACSASSSSATASRSSAAAAARRPTTSRAIKERCGAHEIGAAPRPAPAARLLDDRRVAAGAGARADDRRRARQLAGLAQGQGAAAGRRLRRPAAGRRGPGRGRRARARPLRRADRAPGRGRADAARGQEGLAHAARRRSRSTRPSPT